MSDTAVASFCKWFRFWSPQQSSYRKAEEVWVIILINV